MSTTEPSIEDGTCVAIDVAPRTDPGVLSASIERGHPSIDTTDATSIEITGVDDPDALVCPPPEEVGLSNVEVVVNWSWTCASTRHMRAPGSLIG